MYIISDTDQKIKMPVTIELYPSVRRQSALVHPARQPTRKSIIRSTCSHYRLTAAQPVSIEETTAIKYITPTCILNY